MFWVLLLRGYRGLRGAGVCDSLAYESEKHPTFQAHVVTIAPKAFAPPQSGAQRPRLIRQHRLHCTRKVRRRRPCLPAGSAATLDAWGRSTPHTPRSLAPHRSVRIPPPRFPCLFINPDSLILTPSSSYDAMEAVLDVIGSLGGRSGLFWFTTSIGPDDFTPLVRQNRPL